MGRMSVLVVPTRYMPNVGGIETLLRHTLPLLRDQGYDPVIVTEGGGELPSSSVIDGVQVYRLPFVAAAHSNKPAAILDVTRRLRDIEAEHDVALRHIHGLDYNMFFVWRRQQRAPLPLVISVHGTLDAPLPFNRITLRMLGSADAVTAVSNGVRDSVAAAVPELHADDVRVIPNAVNAPRSSAPWAPRGHLFAAGRLHDQKGFDLAIDALSRLTTRYPDLWLHIAGTGEEEATLRRDARRLGVAARVRFLGTLTHDEMRREISTASVVVVPSRTIEGFSLVALEAAHLARPVVASSVGGLPETIEDGRTGVLVPPDNADLLAREIGDLLGDHARAVAMGEQARSRATRFDVADCAAGYADVYRSLGLISDSSDVRRHARAAVGG
jgi:glycogen synthase